MLASVWEQLHGGVTSEQTLKGAAGNGPGEEERQGAGEQSLPSWTIHRVLRKGKEV